VTKSSAQLDAEIDAALHERKSSFTALIAKIEKAIDAHPELTRNRPAKRGAEEAELTFRNGMWTASCRCRSRIAKGRGARQMHTTDGHGDTPEEAVDDLIDKLPITAEVLRS
jgi:hypothetical protein